MEEIATPQATPPPRLLEAAYRCSSQGRAPPCKLYESLAIYTAKSGISVS